MCQFALSHATLREIILLLGILIAMPSFAQAPAPLQDTLQLTGSSLRAKALCPELSKLAEAIALARDSGQDKQSTLAVIVQSIELRPSEFVLISQLNNYVYEHTKLTPYEHSQRVEIECYDVIP